MRIGSIAVVATAAAACLLVAGSVFVDRTRTSHMETVASLDAEIGSPVRVEGLSDAEVVTSDRRDVYVGGKDGTGRLVIERYARSEISIGPRPSEDSASR